MRRVLVLFSVMSFLLLSLSARALNLPIMKSFEPVEVSPGSFQCSEIMGEFQNYQNLVQVHDERLHLYLNDLSLTLRSWKHELMPFESEMRQVQEGAFENISLSSQVLSQASEDMYQIHDQFDEYFSVLISELENCLELNPQTLEENEDPLITALYNYSFNARSLESYVAMMVEEKLNDDILPWYEQWSLYEGESFQFPQGTFEPIQELSYEFGEAAMLVQSSSSILLEKRLKPLMEQVKNRLEAAGQLEGTL